MKGFYGEMLKVPQPKDPNLANVVILWIPKGESCKYAGKMVSLPKGTKIKELSQALDTMSAGLYDPLAERNRECNQDREITQSEYYTFGVHDEKAFERTLRKIKKYPYAFKTIVEESKKYREYKDRGENAKVNEKIRSRKSRSTLIERMNLEDERRFEESILGGY